MLLSKERNAQGGGEGLQAPSLHHTLPTPMRLPLQVELLGRRHPRAHLPPKPSDVAVLCYTSGTTGVPKGEGGSEILQC